MTVHGCGLRISEATQLKASDIDRPRMQLRVRNGKGALKKSGVRRKVVTARRLAEVRSRMLYQLALKMSR
jgi:integrase